ncbi:butyrophilin subfamily 3 member A2-like isoform X2 [Channa argus]|uniref:butyrophilin subfamily 3 member A2-like isoform X2 n=1 Tax=Channa argus TaxID=215402 RepID=UPI0035226D49
MGKKIMQQNSDLLFLSHSPRLVRVVVFCVLVLSCRASDDAAPLVINLSGIDRDSGGMVLQCESKGWYPEPEVLWLDGEGNFLSAGPTETVRGPDGLYNVSSRVTVGKRHGHRFTLRVQQNNTNQTRETHIDVSDYFFNVQSSFSCVTVGLAVSLAVCVELILVLVFILWKKEHYKSKRKQRDEMDERKSRSHFKVMKTDAEISTEDKKESEQLMEQMEDLNKGNVLNVAEHLDGNLTEINN